MVTWPIQLRSILKIEDWRRIDIDAIDPENQISAEELKPEVTPVSSEEVQSRISTLRSYTSKGSYNDANPFITEDPPYGADDASKVSVKICYLYDLGYINITLSRGCFQYYDQCFSRDV